MSTTTKEKITLHLEKAKAKHITDAFGISDKRAEALCETILHQWNQQDTTTAEALVNIADSCESHEELAWASFTFGCHVAEEAVNPMISLAQALGLN